MRQIFSFFVLTFLLAWGGTGLLPAQAQGALISEWPRGMVVLNDGDTIRGPLTYYRAEDLIQVQAPDGSVQAFAPVNVYAFTVSSGRNARRQVFRTHMWNRGKDYSDFKSPAFFEQLSREGQYSLVKRESVVRRDMNQEMMFRRGMYRYDPYMMGAPMMGPRFVEQVKDHFFLLSPDGKIQALRNPKKDLLSAFDDKSRQVKSFIKENNITFTTSQDLIRVIAFYNSLVDL
ncbi:hypothetical protein BH24BAC1_BH24BAC1_17160 [soil metagenome]